MTQPNVYWTLDAPFVRIVGLYTNVAAGGYVDEAQRDWFVEEVAAAPEDQALLVALHHGPYSVDATRSGSAAMAGMLDQSFARSGAYPMRCSRAR
jgi:3',5'-cyclic AMP phosphodiesterase CpdA